MDGIQRLNAFAMVAQQRRTIPESMCPFVLREAASPPAFERPRVLFRSIADGVDEIDFASIFRPGTCANDEVRGAGEIRSQSCRMVLLETSARTEPIPGPPSACLRSRSRLLRGSRSEMRGRNSTCSHRRSFLPKSVQQADENFHSLVGRATSFEHQSNQVGAGKPVVICESHFQRQAAGGHPAPFRPAEASGILCLKTQNGLGSPNLWNC